MHIDLPTFLPGRLTLAPGTPADYRTLEQFHYASGRPATWASVWIVRYRERFESRIVAVGVLSYPVPSFHLREWALGRSGFTRDENLVFANANIRTISRVIVHPQFRSMGLSTRLVQCLCEHCDTRYIESIARMGRAHPFFERAGMKRIDSDDPNGALYFLMDRESSSACSRRASSPATRAIDQS